MSLLILKIIHKNIKDLWWYILYPSRFCPISLIFSIYEYLFIYFPLFSLLPFGINNKKKDLLTSFFFLFCCYLIIITKYHPIFFRYIFIIFRIFNIFILLKSYLQLKPCCYYPDAFHGWNIVSSIGAILSVVANWLFLYIVYLQLIKGKIP
jgi:hypothetical protein